MYSYCQAYLYCCSPEYFSYEELLSNDNKTNLAHAFDVAHRHMGIERLLDPEGQSPRARHSNLLTC